MKAAKTQKNLREMPYPPQEKLLKRKGNSMTPAKSITRIPNSTNFFRTPNEKKNLKMKLE